MSAGNGSRRASHVDMPVAYAAVGASRAPDLLRFPPDGSTPYQEELRLGSGQERFLLASSLLMTWGAQRGSGATVHENERGTGSAYQGPQFDRDGVPQAVTETEEHFGPNGEPFVVAGTRATLIVPGNEDREVLVIYTITEARVIGFAWGTSDERGAVGEQLFTVELRDDDTVWAVARGFLAAPKGGLFGLRARAEVRGAVAAVRAQLAALLPGAQATATLGADDADAAGEVSVSEAPAAAEADAAAEPASTPVPAWEEAPVTAVIELPEESEPEQEPAPDAEPEPAQDSEQAHDAEPGQAADPDPAPPADPAPATANTHQRRPSSSRSA
ncbi:DUF1990 family protein [Leucobacter chromiireducens]|uniref:DUF1990 family protein n=1 Tax=Leucobacter chromiireducens TaxID=283877 RepID=UPI001F155609|nr:DUF1990 family protein [Leucobacter chromiireducens]